MLEKRLAAALVVQPLEQQADNGPDVTGQRDGAALDGRRVRRPQRLEPALELGLLAGDAALGVKNSATWSKFMYL